MKCQNGDAGGQAVQGQQGISLQILGDGIGGEQWHEGSCDCL